MAHYRTIDVDGRDWRYNVGSTFVEIRPIDDGPKFLPRKTEVNVQTVAALSKEEIEENPKLLDQVTPAEIAAYIRKNCLKT